MVLHWPLTCFLIFPPFLSFVFRSCRRRSRVVRPIGLDSLGTNYRRVPLLEQLLCSYCDRSSCVGCFAMLVFCAQLVFCCGKHSFLSRCFWCYFLAASASGCEMFKSLQELRDRVQTNKKTTRITLLRTTRCLMPRFFRHRNRAESCKALDSWISKA